MGQIQNKTYTAPDGSVYQVEDDGSITKIKSGKIQSNEPPSKYQITDDGQSYRVESDGSVTYLGNAEAKKAYTNKSNINKTKKSHGWIWILLILGWIWNLLILGLVGLGIYALVYYNKQNSIQPYDQLVEDVPHEAAIQVECESEVATQDETYNQDYRTVHIDYSTRRFYFNQEINEFCESEDYLWEQDSFVTLTGRTVQVGNTTLLETVEYDNEHNSNWYIREECTCPVEIGEA